MKVAFLYGSEDTEHLRIELDQDAQTVQFISHELAPVGSVAQQTQWRDRVMITTTIKNMQRAWKEISNEKVLT